MLAILGSFRGPLANLGRDLSAKRLQLLKEAFPRVTHVVLLFEPDNVGSVSEAKEIEEAARCLGLRITPIELRQPADTEPAFRRGAALGAQAYIFAQDGVVGSQSQAFSDRIIRLMVPAMSFGASFVEAGGLMSYGPSFTENFRHAARYVDKILKCAKPGDLPIEQPTRFEMVINMKTAKALRLSGRFQPVAVFPVPAEDARNATGRSSTQPRRTGVSG